MRGPEKQAIVVRNPDGELVDEGRRTARSSRTGIPSWACPSSGARSTFCDSMVNGVKALMYSAEFYPEDEEDSGALQV